METRQHRGPRPADSSSRTPPAAPRDRRWVLLAALVVTAVTVAVLHGGGPALGGDGVPGRGGSADGRVGDARLTADDLDHPTIAHLDPALREALRAATAEARADGVEVLVTSGWRSRAYQQRLLDEAVQTRGSREEALRWVASPDTSRHVLGEAVDVGPTDAAHWMAEHGAEHGLCQVYANEIWHYELLTAPGGPCPSLRADSAS